MSSKAKNTANGPELYTGDEKHHNDRIAVVVSKWHGAITEKLYESAKETLNRYGVERLVKLYVPGAFELPLAARSLASSKRFDAIICIGCIIKGETRHNDYISQAIVNGIMNVSLKRKLPIILGVLTTENETQALDRSGGKYGNKGAEFAVAALEMIDLMKATKPTR